MKCPVCSTTTLARTPLNTGAVAYDCPRCTGRWLPFDEHQKLGAGAGAGAHAAAKTVESPSPADIGKAKLCPHCGRLLTRLRVSMDLPFHLERCGACAGVWFDAGEWTALEARGWIPRLYHLLNDAGQYRLQQQETAAAHEARCRRIVGEADFAKAKGVKAWLDDHPHRATLLAWIDEGRPGRER